jgi:DNA-binding NarL/FixJ family response regulator
MQQRPFLSQFTMREQEIFAHVVEGQPNKVIADLLKISEHTVEQHLQHIYIKLKVSGRAKAVWLCGGLMRAAKRTFSVDPDGTSVRS